MLVELLREKKRVIIPPMDTLMPLCFDPHRPYLARCFIPIANFSINICE